MLAPAAPEVRPQKRHQGLGERATVKSSGGPKLLMVPARRRSSL